MWKPGVLFVLLVCTFSHISNHALTDLHACQNSLNAYGKSLDLQTCVYQWSKSRFGEACVHQSNHICTSHTFAKHTCKPWWTPLVPLRHKTEVGACFFFTCVLGGVVNVWKPGVLFSFSSECFLILATMHLQTFMPARIH